MVSKCFYVNSEKEIEIVNQKNQDKTSDFGLYHTCNVQFDKLECKPIKDDIDTQLNFYKYELQVPRKLKNLKVTIMEPNGLKYSNYVSGDTHVCAIFEKPVIVDSWQQNVQMKLQCWGDNIHQQLDFPKEVNEKVRSLTPNNLDRLILKAQGNTTCLSIKNVRMSTRNIEGAITYYLFSFTQCWGQILYKIYEQQDLLEIGLHDSMCYAQNKQDSLLNCISTRHDNKILEIPIELRSNNKSISVGMNHGCTLIETRLNHPNLGCWGNNDHGQTNVPNSLTYSTASYIASQSYSCAAKLNAHLVCWGKLDHGTLFRFKTIDIDISTQISAGGTHACGIQNGELKCRGKDDFNQLEIPATHVFDSKQVQAGWDFTCSLNMRDKVDCWGLNLLGQADVPEKLQLPMLSVVSVQTSLNRSCAVQFDNILTLNTVCWGGHDEFGENSIPYQQTGLTQQVAVGDFHTCLRLISRHDSNIIRQNNNMENIKCFGKNVNGQTDVPMILQQIPKSITAGDEHTCYQQQSTILATDTFIPRIDADIAASSSIYSIICWGSDSFGQSTVPIFDTNSYTQYHQLTAGDNHTCVIVNDGTDHKLTCWGLGQQEEGKGLVNLNTLQVTLGNDYDCLIDSNWMVKCWGENEFGQCDIQNQGLAQSFRMLT